MHISPNIGKHICCSLEQCRLLSDCWLVDIGDVVDGIIFVCIDVDIVDGSVAAVDTGDIVDTLDGVLDVLIDDR